MQNRFLTAHDQGVTGVRATLKTNHVISMSRKNVDDFAFALIAPLGAYDHDSGHC
jgi:hypothetical protein